MLAEFHGNDRFDVVRRLGTGASGVVYEVIDRRRDVRVALKTLARLDAAALYRFKREFRALADVSHPNLVQLYELFAEKRGWYFTMELVAGRDFLTFVRNRDDGHEAPLEPTLDGANGAVPQQLPALTRKIATNAELDVDPARVRMALSELARGVAALHDAGMLHRDLKPSNVLVTDAGRAVIVDFGIVADVVGDAFARNEVEHLVGTPGYMAPEQGNGDDIGPPADWYAVGVILYEALTGRLPFLGAPLQVLSDKMRFEPAPPRELRRGVPEDLDRLCVDLLRRDPEARPSGAEVLRRLGAIEPGAISGRIMTATHATSVTTFIGRDDALERLRRAFDRARAGSCVRVRVSGRSGMGKTALVRRFLEDVAVAAGPVVLSARCYERESVPYKALDGVVDALSLFLRSLPRAEADALIPPGVSPLARVFPVLARVPAIADAPKLGEQIRDAHQLRARAFAAMRELLARIGAHRPLVVFIDDLQWGDADSAALLQYLTSGDDAPPMLVILAHRTEDEEGTAVRAFRSTDVALGEGAAEEISVDALSEEEARGLAGALLGVPRDHLLARTVALEARGNALFVGELVRYVQSSPTRQSATGLRLDRVLRTRVDDLAHGPRRVLEVLSIADRPIRLEVVAHAAELSTEETLQAIAALRLAHFARSSGSGERKVFEPFHDRVRKVVCACIDPEDLRELHARLADGLRAAGNADPELLFSHFASAGNVEAACEQAELAAAKAERALAFDRAVQFFRYVLDARGEDDPRAQPVRVALATALAHGGRGREAAQLFLAAADRANEADRLDLRRRAAEQLLQSGHVEEGVRAMQDVLSALGMRLATSPRRALITLLFLRLWLRVRLALGAAARPTRDVSSLPATDLTRIDVCWSVGTGLSAVDNVRAAMFQTRNTLLCLDAREPLRLARALALEATLQASVGPRNVRRVERIVDSVRRLAERRGTPEIAAYLRLCEGALYYFTGRWKDAAETWSAIDRFFQEHVGESAWERNTFRFFGLCSHVFAGDFARLAEALPSHLRDAEERGNLYLLTILRVGDPNLVWVVRGEPETAIAHVRQAMARWTRRGFQLQHWYELQALANVDLYRGRASSALERLDRGFSNLSRTMQLRIFLTRLKALHLRARAAIGTALERNDGSLLVRAERDAEILARDRCPAAMGVAELVRAGVAHARKDEETKVSRLRAAIDELERASMSIYAAAARRALGTAIGGDEGRELVEAGTARMREETIHDVELTTRLYLGYAG